MLRLSNYSRFLLTALCLLAVALRLGSAHVHLCMDGNEPPVSYHFDGIAGLHHAGIAHEESNTEVIGAIQHTDIDISLVAEALFKTSDAGLDLLEMFTALVAALALLWAARPVAPLPLFFRPPGDSRLVCLWPPLRGPPAPHLIRA